MEKEDRPPPIQRQIKLIYMPLGYWELTNIEDEMSTFDSIFGWKIVSSWIWAHQSYTFFWNQLSQTKYEWNIWKKHQYRFCETERIFTESIWALKAIFFVLKIKLPQPTHTHTLQRFWIRTLLAWSSFEIFKIFNRKLLCQQWRSPRMLE